MNPSSSHVPAGAQASTSFINSLRSLARSTIPRGCGSKPRPLNQSTNVPLHHALKGSEVTTEKVPSMLTQNNCSVPKIPEDHMHDVTEGLEAAEDTSAQEPLYYVLEGPSPTPESNQDPMYHVVKELRGLNASGPERVPSSDSIADPLYYVLEGPSPTPESNQDQMYHVLKELRGLNANGPERVPSSDSIADPLYYVLENSDDLEDKNAEEQTKL